MLLVKKDIVYVVILLLNNGADPNVPNKLTDSKYFSLPLQIAVRRGHAMIVDMLLEKGAKLNQTEEPLLHIACVAEWKTVGEDGKTCVEHVLPIVALLLQQGVDVNAISSKGDTALYRACESQQLEVVQMLLEAGADVNLTSNRHYPLVAAWEAGNAPLINLLVKAGADVKCIEHLLDKGRLVAACLNQNAELVDTLLKYGEDPNLASTIPDSESKHGIPLFIAIKNVNSNIVASLLNAGADVNAINDKRKSVLTYAAEKMINSRYCQITEMMWKLSTIRLLLRRGATFNSNSPLCLALFELKKKRRIGLDWYRAGVIQLLQLMLEYGAVRRDSSRLSGNTYHQSRLLMALATYDGRHEFIVDLFRAGTGIHLIAFCCNAVATSPLEEKSIPLCKAAVLAGYSPSVQELQRLQLAAASDNTAGHLIQQLVNWLNEERQQAPSLLRQCRIAIRRQLSVAVHFQTILPAIDKLPLPTDLKRYLRFGGKMSEVDLSIYKGARQSSPYSSLTVMTDE